MASMNGTGGDGRHPGVTNKAGNVFTFQNNTGQILKDGSTTSLAAIPAREIRYGNGDDKVYTQDANGGWKSYNGTTWVPDKNPMGM